ncbi:helix-turn-helix domain-containing protein [Planktomarina sp.]|nr:helix-turn-helix transcriptional regulator [Planktomarina sp.]MDB4841063.1 helix-turn-helix domain-containing protein [Planktomarina sp.]
MMSTLTVEQIRMARAALGWSFEIMAEKCGVSSRTLRRIESEDGLQKATSANLRLIRETLQGAGIEFIGDADDGPGVRLWPKSNQS